jgi:hypothetical protein
MKKTNQKNNLDTLPFIEKKENNIYERKFSKDVNESELKWHFDNEDRVVVCEHETNWLFQMDNKLPIKIEKNKSIYIPEGEYHRIIKGDGDLILKINKKTPEHHIH